MTLASLLLAVAPLAAAGAPAKPRPPNIVLISIDTLRADHLGAYGYTRASSPNIDAFAKTATLFEDAVAPSPKTTTSHMTLFTGLHPSVHGITNWGEGPDGRLSDDIPTLATLLRAGGYTTAAYTAGGNVQQGKGLEQGFDSYVSSWEGGGLGLGWLALADRAKQPAANRRPFFLFLHTYEVHDPYLPPPAYAQLFTDPSYSGRILSRDAFLALGLSSWQDKHRAFWKAVRPTSVADIQHLQDLYDGCIRRMDEAVGVLLDTLRSTRLEADTIVVFLSDHGEEFHEHGGFTHNNLYQEVLHVPLIVRVPGRAGWGARRVKGLAGLIDVLPTLLDLVGLPTPSHVQGRSVAGLLQSAPQARYALSEWLIDGRQALRIGDRKFIVSSSGEQLYDLAADPGETRALPPGDAYEIRMKLARLTAGFGPLRAQFGPGRKAKLDEQTKRELQALGYLGGP